MKKVIKVSIGNIAFTLEEDGYNLVKRYLDNISDHYYAKQNGNEIIEGIEERMAELIMERCGSNTVVSQAIIEEVISILGRPVDFDETDDNDRARTRRRLYRDADNRILGGVCSGIAAYFNMDVVPVRIAFVVLLLIFSSIGWASFMRMGDFHIPSAEFMVLVYIVLWVIIPKARTVEQRYAMHGETVDLSNIQESVRRGAQQVGTGIRRASREGSAIASGLGRFIVSFIGIIFIIIAVTGLITLSFLFLGVEIFHGVFPFEVFDYIELGVWNPIYIKVLMIATLMLPMIGILYAGIQMLFNFRSPRWRPGLVIFLLWLVSLIFLAALSVRASRPYWDNSEYSEEFTMNQAIDTLYIDMKSNSPVPDSRVFFDAGRRNYNLLWIDGPRKNRTITVYPSIVIRRNYDTEKKISFRSFAFSYNHAEAYIKAESIIPPFSLTDSLLTIHPEIYSRGNRWDGTHNKIYLYVPEEMHVVVRGPVKHDFQRRVRWHWDY